MSGPRRRSVLRRLARAAAPHLPFDLDLLHRRARAARREAIAFLVRWSGFPLLARTTYARRRAAILVYHNPEPETLERHLRFLSRRRYRFVALDELVDALRSGDWGKLPPRSVAVTLDDGHRGNVRLLDVFARYGVRPTLFVCTQIVGTHRRFWFTEVDSRTRDSLFELPNEERLMELEREIGFRHETEASDGEAQALGAAELAAMDGRVELAAHTRFHPILPSCDDATSVDEILGSKAEVEALTGRPCRHFSYPNGRYGQRELALVREAGFASARTIETGWTTAGTDPYRLPILGMPDDASLNIVAAQLTGLAYVRNLMYG
jgi:peptidoglycan/xylan/chitin deacetylase (PgdA/CDA1 family)